MPTRDEIERAMERFEARITNAKNIQDNGDYGCVDIETWERYQRVIDDCNLAIACMQEQIKEPTDDEVQMAINDLEESYRHAVIMEDSYVDLPMLTDSILLAITALRQMRTEPWVIDEGRFPDEAEKEYNKNFEAKCNKTGINLLAEPRDADVAEAIKILDFLNARYHGVQVMCNIDYANVNNGVQTAITALRQMRTEPCWYCKGIELHNIKSVKTVTDESDRELGAYDTPYNYCPNCGRKLEDE